MRAGRIVGLSFLQKRVHITGLGSWPIVGTNLRRKDLPSEQLRSKLKKSTVAGTQVIRLVSILSQIFRISV